MVWRRDMGKFVVGILEGGEHGGPDLDCPAGEDDAELAQQAAQQVDRGGAGGLAVLAHAMQGLDALLVGALDRHRRQARAAIGFEQAGGVGAIGLVAAHIGPHVVRGQQAHGVPQAAEAPPPVVGAAAGLHDDAQRRAILEQGGEAQARGHAQGLDRRALGVGVGELEHILCQVDGNGRSMHGGLLSCRSTE